MEESALKKLMDIYRHACIADMGKDSANEVMDAIAEKYPKIMKADEQELGNFSAVEMGMLLPNELQWKIDYDLVDNLHVLTVNPDVGNDGFTVFMEKVGENPTTILQYEHRDDAGELDMVRRFQPTDRSNVVGVQEITIIDDKTLEVAYLNKNLAETDVPTVEIAFSSNNIAFEVLPEAIMEAVDTSEVVRQHERKYNVQNLAANHPRMQEGNGR